ncbi:lipopolysaccharide heptosyltransferase II [uncultured Helicobacter sp.]|uniref:lipopolysaccharide heptosyltransferase II n=2 Tax=uncultured Helicobacter sp. TaxID=175537 RepID=UPI0026F2FA89|nr:lipopolysaccharide heptosyltransferase II [uncultured Helicobacter sp.]
MFFTKDIHHIHTSQVKSILLRLPNWLGDSVMVSPAFEWLKKSFETAQFTLVGTKASCGIYERDKRVKAIFIDTTKAASCRIIATKALANKIGTHDIAISFSNTFFSALLLYWSKSPLRIGYGKNARNFLLSHPLTLHKYHQNRLKHQVLLYLELITPLSQVQNYAIKTQNSADFIQDFAYKNDKHKKDSINLSNHSHIKISHDEILTYLATQPLHLISSPITLPTKSYAIGINPGAAFGSAKCWEKSYFIDIIKHFLTQGYDVYLFGSSEQSRANVEIAQSFINHPQAQFFHNLTDKTSLTQLIDYIGAMNVFITNDSGPMHIAAALNVPMIAIFGPTNIDETAPYSPAPLAQNHTLEIQSAANMRDTQDSISPHIIENPPHWVLLCKYVPCAPCKKRECPLTHHRCMTLITPQEVITHTMNLLKNNDKRLNNDT